MYFCSSGLDLGPMTLIYKLNLYPLKVYLHTKNVLLRSRHLKVTTLQTDIQTDVTKCIIVLHSHSLES